MDDKISVTLEPLEKIFQQVEEESERRAQEEELDTFSTTNNGLFYSHSSMSNGNGTLSTASKRTRSRRRGSISISRLGQLTTEDFNYRNRSSSGPPTPNLVSSIASNSPFYQAQIANSSVASFASGLYSDPAHTEESNHITQVHQIAGRASLSKKVGNMIPRRLSRARSASVLAPSSPSDVGVGVVIGVSVQEKTVEGEAEEGNGANASVQAGSGLKNQKSRMTIAGSEAREERQGWMARARGFTQKFRRKSSKQISMNGVIPP